MYVILNEVKNLIESAAHKTEILRLRLIYESFVKWLLLTNRSFLKCF
jgi:hypothetical protein